MDTTSNVVNVSNTDNMDTTSNVVNVSNTDNMDTTSNVVNVSNTDNMDSTSNVVSVSNTDNIDSTSNVVSVSNTDNMDSTSNVVSVSNTENSMFISNLKNNVDIAKDTGNKYCEMKAYLDLSTAYRETQQYDEAIKHARECIRIIKEISTKKANETDDPNSLDVAGIYIKDESLGSVAAAAYFNLGQSEAHLALFEDALYSFQKCATIATEIGEEMPRVLSCYSIAKLYELKRQWDDVIEFSRKYIDKMSIFSNKEMEIEAYLRFATALVHINRYEEAVAYGKKCIETVGDSQESSTEMRALPILGKSYLELNSYREAIECGKKHLEIATATGNKEAEIEAHYLLAETYYRSDQIDSGYKHATKGMAIAEELKNDTAMKRFRSLLSGFYALVGMQDKASLYDPDLKVLFEVPTCLRRELEALVKAVKAGDVHQQYVTQFRLYNYYKSKLKYESAITCLKRAREIALQTNDSQAKMFVYAPIGELYIGMKKYKEGLEYCEGGLNEVAECKNKKILFDFYFYISQLYAANDKLQSAEQYLNKAIQCFEAFYGSLGSNDDMKISMVDRYNGCFRFLSLVYLQTNRNREALLILDKCRARVLKDILVANYGIQENNEANDITFSDIEALVSSNKFAILYYSICGFGNALAFLIGLNCLEASVQQVCFEEKRYHQLIDKMFDEIEVFDQDVNCENRILDTDQDIKHQKKEEEDEREMFEIQLQKRNFMLHKKTIVMYDNKECRPGAALEFLYCLIIGEGQSLIKQSEIVFIPDGSLCKIPFAALQDPDTGRYLSETKRIRVAPSLATLKLLSENAPDYHSNEGALIIGDPRVCEVMLDGEVTEIPKLEKAQIEAKAIAISLGVEPLIGAAATKQAVLEKLQQGVSVVHIAAHGYLEKASIALAPSPEIRYTKIPDEEDYMLTMADVQQAQVRAQLVVLSCCHSGRGEIRSEGVVGMCRAFLASGARAVVASLWAIDDEATLEFMLIFYENLRNGKSASTSLQETMNEMRINTCSKYKQPKYWAPFFIMGDDVTLHCF